MLKHAWMKFKTFSGILTEFNKAMLYQKRHVLLFLDNCSAHVDLNLTNVKVQFFPPNVMSWCHPLNMGVIPSFKCHYKSEIQLRHVKALNMGLKASNITVLDSVFTIKQILQSHTSDHIKLFPESRFDL